ncbi:ankyrin repeat ph and sec7 domain containing protein secg-related [Holotrichia oblita]|uniref:Ankyrin repeat ph and sec7 domain containing protein secg-related n=1 Tax=Holotrichia oblita TaxID=644536 RepID=A0ACB9T525_HOLOL|nr:ankyrin repeat ph and sec7 domain containing protein secg-related [Holotrichia oblita]
MDIKFSNIPLTLRKDLNTILLSWDNIISEYENLNLESILFVKKKQGWNYLYRGTKTQYLVNDLEPSTCYTFKLKIYDADEVIDTIKFKASTEFEPYYNFHIIRAITKGKTSLLRKVAAQRPLLLELENKDNKTPLIIVAEIGDLSMASLLITLGANVNSQLMGSKRTPLMVSLFHNNLQISALLLDKGADISLKDCNGLTCMHYAIDSGNLETVQFIVEHGIDVNVADNKGWTGLLRADDDFVAVVMENNDEIIKYLIENGADINVKDKNGFDYYKHCEISGRNANLQDVQSPSVS